MADTSKLTTHQRIMRAAKAGQGVRLSAAEVSRPARDQAIITCAGNDDAQDGIAGDVNARPYADPAHPGNDERFLTGKLCIEGCGRPAGTCWSPLWCVECNTLRMDRISASLDEIQAIIARGESDV
ncbi:MAG: hypothetical protein IT379_16770 [Deltaproteobacteria bacterium]|nr:hypothetical protein [Deltaproteobacteria bacterium]